MNMSRVTLAATHTMVTNTSRSLLNTMAPVSGMAWPHGGYVINMSERLLVCRVGAMMPADEPLAVTTTFITGWRVISVVYTLSPPRIEGESCREYHRHIGWLQMAVINALLLAVIAAYG